MADRNRRTSSREPVKWQAEWRVQDGEPQYGEVCDFTPEGLFLRCQAPIPAATRPGARIRIDFPSPKGATRREVSATIQWAKPQERTVGVRFDAADRELEEYLAFCREAWIGS